MNERTGTGVGAAASSTAISKGGQPARRLGRGLSALINVSVPVDAGQAEVPADALSNGSAGHRGGAGPAGAESGGGGEDNTRGVGASASETRGEREIVSIAIDRIVPSPFQPRKHFDAAAIAELAASITSAGLIQPIVVRRSGSAPGVGEGGGHEPSRFELVAGERRWRAARHAGLARLPAVVVEISDEQAAEWALIENVQRTDLSPLERGEALKSLGEKFGLTHQALAEKIGLDRSSVTNLIRLTELEPALAGLIQSGELSLGHGKALLSLAPGSTRVELGRRAAQEGWNVRKLEATAASLRGREAAPGDVQNLSVSVEPKLSKREIQLRDLERQLSEHLGTKVRIRTDKSGKRGSVQLAFFDLDHFDGLMTKLGFVMR